MKDQLEIEELSQVIEHEREDKIKRLEEELEQAKNYAMHTEEAANILKDLVQKGEVKQNEDGTISVVRVPNVIMNED